MKEQSRLTLSSTESKTPGQDQATPVSALDFIPSFLFRFSDANGMTQADVP